MTRVNEALKALESRRQAQAPQRHQPVAPPAPQVAVATPVTPVESATASPTPTAPSAPAARQPGGRAHALENMVLLPTVPVVADHYHELAERIAEQLATNYCNVLLFVSPDDAATPCFSMTHLAQAFSLQSTGDVLLVDGDLTAGRLSKTVCSHGPGLAEAMLGTAQWPEIIHSTTTPRVDFVSRGEGSIAGGDEHQLGWGALRPKYRDVLIGVADAREPQTARLAAHCDGVYLLVARLQTKRADALAAAESLRACGVNLLGTILVND
jgi:Mrp family chromosome partitioning ATPase